MPEPRSAFDDLALRIQRTIDKPSEHPTYIGYHGHEMKSMPGIGMTIISIFLQGVAILFELSAIIIDGSVIVGTLGIFLCVLITIFLVKIALPIQLRRRAQYRKEKYEAWLRRPVPELQEQEPWSEIERATESLLSEGVDPTYERACDWLRKDRLREMREESKKHGAMCDCEVCQEVQARQNEQIVSVFKVPPAMIGNAERVLNTRTGEVTYGKMGHKVGCPKGGWPMNINDVVNISIDGHPAAVCAYCGGLFSA